MERKVGSITYSPDFKGGSSSRSPYAAAPQMKTPKVGSIVHYILPEGSPYNYEFKHAGKPGDHVTAKVTHVWSDGRIRIEFDMKSSGGPLAATGKYWREVLLRDDSGKTPDSWHWPE